MGPNHCLARCTAEVDGDWSSHEAYCSVQPCYHVRVALYQLLGIHQPSTREAIGDNSLRRMFGFKGSKYVKAKPTIKANELSVVLATKMDVVSLTFARPFPSTVNASCYLCAYLGRGTKGTW